MHLTIEADVSEQVGQEWHNILANEKDPRAFTTQAIEQIIQQKKRGGKWQGLQEIHEVHAITNKDIPDSELEKVALEATRSVRYDE